MNRAPWRRLAAILAVSATVATPAGIASAASGPVAGVAVGQISVYQPAPGARERFERGYARHLGWHLAAADPWPWYVYRILSGERRGQYLGATFDHAPVELDARPRPADDAADHAATIDTQLERVESRYVLRRPELGGSLDDFEAAAYLALIEVRPHLASRQELEDALVGQARAGATRPHAWFEVIAGGPLPTYLLLVPMARMSELAAVRLDALPPFAGAGVEAAAQRARLAGAIATIETTLLRLAPELSTCRRAVSGCLGTVPAEVVPAP